MTGVRALIDQVRQEDDEFELDYVTEDDLCAAVTQVAAFDYLLDAGLMITVRRDNGFGKVLVECSKLDGSKPMMITASADDVFEALRQAAEKWSSHGPCE